MFRFQLIKENVFCYVGLQVAEMINSFREDMPVVITGGMRHNKAFMSCLKKYLNSFEVAQHEPVYGAYVYAKEKTL